MTRVCVIFGGASSEHEVSLRSAKCIIDNIDRSKYEVVTLGITKDGRWFYYYGPSEFIATGQWQKSSFLERATISPDPSEGGILLLGEVDSPSKKVRSGFLSDIKPVKVKNKKDGMRVIPVDVVFPVLHGKNGEDGTIQGLLDMAQLPYVGCGVLASAACMDKEVTHIILKNAGIPKTELIALTAEDLEDFTALFEKLESQIEYPMFVKPANAGSSVGVSKVKERAEILPALEKAFEHDHKVVVEKAVVGREIECAIWGNTYPCASESLGEIIPSRDFYDYDGKYNDDTAGLVAPAEIDDAIAENVRTIAKKAYKTMGCRGLARVDFFVRPDGSPVLNEINTLPGFTSISMYPRLFAEDGVDIPSLIDNLIFCAFQED